MQKQCWAEHLLLQTWRSSARDLGGLKWSGVGHTEVKSSLGPPSPTQVVWSGAAGPPTHQCGCCGTPDTPSDYGHEPQLKLPVVYAVQYLTGTTLYGLVERRLDCASPRVANGYAGGSDTDAQARQYSSGRNSEERRAQTK